MQESLSLDEKFIINIFEKYRRAKIILKNENIKNADSLKEAAVTYGQDNPDLKQLIDYQNHLQTVETILALMPKAEYTCLVKEFLNQTNNLWWKKHYSQDSYQKLKHKAITRFLYLFLI